jgi:hypothetical protein
LYISLISISFSLIHWKKSCAGYCVYLSFTEPPPFDAAAAADTVICKARVHDQSPVATVAMNMSNHRQIVIALLGIICNLCAVAAVLRLVYGIFVVGIIHHKKKFKIKNFVS